MSRFGFIASDRGGGGRCRSFWPAEVLAEAGHVIVHADIGDFPGGAEVVVIHRPLDPYKEQAIERHRAAGAMVLVDEDDDLTELPETFRGLPVAENAFNRHDEAIAAADGLIVSTPQLLDTYGSLAKRSWVCRNFLPQQMAAHRFYKLENDPTVRVGWAGIVDTHRHDLEWFAPAAERAMAGATFTTIGDVRTPRHLRLSNVPCEVWPFSLEADGLYKLMARADIGIVPLQPDLRLNRSKSCLKALEFSILGKPVVATRTPDNERFIRDSVTGYLVDTPGEMAFWVRTLIADQVLREEMGQAAQVRALEYCQEARQTWVAMAADSAGISESRVSQGGLW